MIDARHQRLVKSCPKAIDLYLVFGIFGEFLEFSALLLLRTLVHGFSEFSEFSSKKDKKITCFEYIEILDMGGSIRYTLRYTKKSDISAFDKFPIR